MRQHHGPEAGMTLVELVIAITLSVILVGAAVAGFGAALRDVDITKTRFADSHDAQLVQTYLPADLQSARTVDTNGSAPSGCTGTLVVTPDGSQPNVLQMSWPETVGATSTTHMVAYQIVKPDPIRAEWSLARFACTSSATTAKRVYVAHDVLDPSASEWTSAGADVSEFACGRVLVTILQASGYAYTINGNTRNLGSSSGPICPLATTTTAAPTTTTTLVQVSPEILQVNMFDLRGGPGGEPNGRVDELIVIFSKPLFNGCANSTQWILDDGPSNVVTVANTTFVSGTTNELRLHLVEGSGLPQTAVGSFTVSFNPIAACNALPLLHVIPVDKAGPVATGISSTNVGTVNQFDPGDALTIHFSEDITGPTSPVTVTLALSGGTETLHVPGVTDADMPFGDGYLGVELDAAGDPIPPLDPMVQFTDSAVNVTGADITVTLGACTGDCGSLRAGSGTFTFVPAAGITDTQSPLPNATPIPGVHASGGPIL